ncbi:hypothetical protein B1757_06640 [Acidithiobacillus marinus]|uniref:Uncharacterized protein n=1 Tax=Acidithiobacillus marinus TaxID=187490 RepID=A0A2I1DM91_9PROT|nr:hypothetical protein [Acidithiobacillus marinus]PKY10984.1 hypothetical protein B1757_06640 [Acidithiobacillus marinus]
MKTENVVILWDYSPAKGVHNVLLAERGNYPQRFSDGAVYSDWRERGGLSVVFGMKRRKSAPAVTPAYMAAWAKLFARTPDELEAERQARKPAPAPQPPGSRGTVK